MMMMCLTGRRPYVAVVPAKHKPYSPFQNLNNKAEYAVARLDDLLNWGRKVRHMAHLVLG